MHRLSYRLGPHGRRGRGTGRGGAATDTPGRRVAAPGAGLGSGTVSATSRPRARAERAITAMPAPELVCDSSSMARVDKITVQEP